MQRPGNHPDGRGPVASVEFFDDVVEVSRRQIFVEIVIDLHSRRAGACPDAFHFFQRENAIGRSLFMPNFQAFLRVRQQFGPTAQHARNVGANLHVMFAHQFAMQHGIKRQGLFHLHGFQVQAVCDFDDHLVGDAAVFVLRVHHHRNQGAALDRVAILQLFKFRREFG
jgi:hypothetical protein